jgi:hypothetical protein
MSDDSVTLSRSELKELIKEAVSEAFFDAGLRIDEQESIEEARNDFRFIRWLRNISEKTASQVGYLVLATLIGAFLFATWIGFRIMARVP